MKTISNHIDILSFFGAPKISFDDIINLQEQINPISYWGVPVIIVCAIIELIVIKNENKQEKYDPLGSLTSFAVGLGYLVSAYLTKALLFGVIIWFYNVLPWRQELSWSLLIPCYLIHDFCSYWAHRISHNSRFWWSIHIPHHSSNQYNLWINLRAILIYPSETIPFAFVCRRKFL